MTAHNRLNPKLHATLKPEDYSKFTIRQSAPAVGTAPATSEVEPVNSNEQGNWPIEVIKNYIVNNVWGCIDIGYLHSEGDGEEKNEE